LGNRYSIARQFFSVQDTTGQIGVIWQDKKNKAIKLTKIANKTFKTITLANKQNEILAAATFDSKGFLYYLTIQDGDGIPNTARTSTLYKADNNGKFTKSKNLDGSQAGLNIVMFNGNINNVASLNYANGTLGLILGRKMHPSNDGSNHQGAIAVVFDANTLDVLKNLGQTSGHSFENVLTVNSDNEFVAIDLGDNYPRGVNLHRFTENGITSHVVYTFKTEHSTELRYPALSAEVNYPKYDAISTDLKTYYQWSNDNNTYTELGGVIENSDGYSVIFAGEPDLNGNSLNNARVGNGFDDARNIGLVKVVRDFSSGWGNVVPDSMVLSKGTAETGGFYTFNGTWSEQRNAGVVWLTDYKDKTQTNVSRLKTIKIAEDKILLLWENWNDNSYINTYAMTIDSLGNVLDKPVTLGNHVRLSRSDDPIIIGNSVYIASGNKADSKLELIELKLK